MEWTWVAVLAVCTVVCAGIAVYYYQQKRELYQKMDRMLGELLDDTEIFQSDLQEGECSALAGKARRIQEKLRSEVGGVKQESEQVKSLISNMSHQLKTPLANLMMYGELLEDSELSGQEKKRFLKRMRQQLEKVSWILNSLFKMVKLEENVIEFQAEPNLIRRTLVDAVNLMYDKAQKKQIEINTEYFSDCNLLHHPRWTAEVFANLLENAIKYTEEKGQITRRSVSG